MSKYIGYIGNSSTGKFTVVEHVGASKYIIRFEDGYEKIARSNNIVIGAVRNPYYPRVCSVGYSGEGTFQTKKLNKDTIEYTAWQNMLRRCYDKQEQSKNPTYIECFVTPSWHNFQNFAEWYCNHRNYSKGYDLDKDLKFFGNKIYSPETCDLVPTAINTLLTNRLKLRGDYPIGVSFHKASNKFIATCNMGGLSSGCKSKQLHIGLYSTPEEAFEAYKKVKEDFVKKTAEKYKSEICPEIYNNLMNWTVSKYN